MAQDVGVKMNVMKSDDTPLLLQNKCGVFLSLSLQCEGFLSPEHKTQSTKPCVGLKDMANVN